LVLVLGSGSWPWFLVLVLGFWKSSFFSIVACVKMNEPAGDAVVEARNKKQKLKDTRMTRKVPSTRAKNKVT
jgi:hypothetical protein